VPLKTFCIESMTMNVISDMGAAWTILLSMTIVTAPAAIRFRNFADADGLSLVGDAAVSSQVLRLTPASHDKSGAVWLREKQPVASGFETTFQFQLTGEGGLGHGADGFAFVLQNSGPDALGGRGSAGGFAVSDGTYRHETGIPWSIAVFFDTYRNRSEGDPSANYIAFRTHGRPNQMHWPAERLAFTPKLRVQLKDRLPHTARIVFRPPVLSVFLDASPKPVLEGAVDLSIVLDPEGGTYVGFTASTGGGYENHDILNWSFGSTQVSSNLSTVDSQISFHMSACLPGRNLCTPERALVEQKGSLYHVVLPANLEWGASIANPAGRTVEIANAHGIACWDLKDRGSDGCGGPANGLVMENHGGRTWFSVHGRPGDFKGNEGFYEFDVEIK